MKDSHSFDSRIVRGLVVVTVFVALGRIVGAAKEVVIAYRYGTSEALDIYTFAFVLVSWAPIIVLHLLQSALVPILKGMDNNANQRFCRELNGAILLLGIVSSLILYLIFPQLAAVFNLSFESDALIDFNWALAALTPIIVLMCLNAAFSMRLLAHENHSNTLLEAVPAVMILLAVLFFPGNGPSLNPLIFGTVAGAIVHLFVLMVVTRSVGLAVGISFRFRHEQWRNFVRAIATLFLGAIAMSLIPPIDQIMAARLDAGSLSILSYTTRLLALALGLAITVLTRALLPVLSDKGLNEQGRKHIARRWMLMLFAVGVILVVVGWFLTPTVVGILFERGEFTSIDTQNVSRAVRIGLFQIPILFVGTVLVQLFTSMKRYKVIVGSSFLALGTKVFAGIPLAEVYGLDGIMISTVIMFAVTTSYFLLCYRFFLTQK